MRRVILRPTLAKTIILLSLIIGIVACSATQNSKKSVFESFAVSDSDQKRSDHSSSAKTNEDSPIYADEIPITSSARVPEMYFRHYGVNPTIDTAINNVSTFSVDVDTASYAIARTFLQKGILPDPASIRVEEFINTFNYRYRSPKRGNFNFNAEAFPSPNRHGYHLLHIGLQARRISRWQRKPANLVYLIDVSGSMRGRNRLGLLKRAMRLLTNQMRPDDIISIVAFNTTAKVILNPTLAKHRHHILGAMNKLYASGSTNVQAGLHLAYSLAKQNSKQYSTNRIILISDGVANTGLTTANELFQTIYQGTTQGIQLNAVGIGMGKYNDVLLETLAKKGQGIYTYINNIRDAKKIFVKQLVGTLQLLARDVKLQVEFNPQRVARYRLLGYENRMLKKRDFRDDKKDAAEIGAGHSVTAIFEIKLRRGRGIFGTVRLRFKHPTKGVVREINKQLPMKIVRTHYSQVSSYTKLAYIAAAFAEKLRQSYWVRNLEYHQLLSLYSQLNLSVRNQYAVAELGRLIKAAAKLDNRVDKFASHSPLSQMSFDQVPVLE